MSNKGVIMAGNVAIVQSQDSTCLDISGINPQEPENLIGTVTLPAAPSRAIVDDQYTTVKLLFGSWVESGDEDKDLEELYKSRAVSSVKSDE